jgi:hypothetical protein
LPSPGSLSKAQARLLNLAYEKEVMHKFIIIIIIAVIWYFTIYRFTYNLFSWNPIVFWAMNLVGFGLIWFFFKRRLEELQL